MPETEARPGEVLDDKVERGGQGGRMGVVCLFAVFDVEVRLLGFIIWLEFGFWSYDGSFSLLLMLV